MRPALMMVEGFIWLKLQKVDFFTNGVAAGGANCPWNISMRDLEPFC